MANADVIRKWVEALRSGEYKQTQSVLSSKGRYCCLGVLCDLAVKDGIIPPGTEDTGVLHYGEAANYVLPPAEVRNWAGIGDHDNWLVSAPAHVLAEDVDLWEGPSVPLSYLNDSTRLSFAEIADLIEKEYLSA